MRRLALGLALLLAPVPGATRAEALRPFDAASWRTILHDHAGRPLLVHFWGMTCAPCRIEMPRLGALLARHPGLAVVTIDTDTGRERAGEAEAFLKRSGMPTEEAWRFAGGFAEELYFSVDPAWQGETPRTALVGRDGRVAVLDGALDEAALERALERDANRR